MLTKNFQRTLIPAVAGTPEVPYRAAYTICQPAPAPGHWEQVCTRTDIPVGEGRVIPPGGEVVIVYDPDGTIDPLTGQVIVLDVYIRVCTSQWVVDGMPGPVACTTYPEQPHVPAVPAQPARWEVTPILAWDAGANSTDSQAGDCVCTFTMTRVTGVVVGLTAELAEVQNFARLTHALYFHNGKVQAMEGGTIKSAAVPYAVGDEFKIQRANGVVTYLNNGRRLYTSRAASSGEINVGCALYASGDTIE